MNRKGLVRGEIIVLLTMLLATACSTVVADSEIIEVFVPASVGGTFSDDASNPGITITIPPGALTQDAELEVELSANRDNKLSVTQAAASRAYKVKLSKAGDGDDDSGARRDGELKLIRPMQIAIVADYDPVHPQLGEIARVEDDAWQRMEANFYRASSSTAVTLTKRTRGNYRVVFRTLQARSGPAVERGRELYFHETWTAESYWGDVFGMHQTLNNVDLLSATSLGAQFDISKIPQRIIDVLQGDDYALKQSMLSDPETTRVLARAGAFVGIVGIYKDPENPGNMTSVGLSCASCHVKVTKTEFQIFAPPAAKTVLAFGIPVVGPPNNDLDVGTMLSFTPLVQTGSENYRIDEYRSWGPGTIDTRFFPGNPLDDGVNNPSQIPQNWNYMDLAEQGYSVTWNGVLNIRPGNDSLASALERGNDFSMGINGAWGTENAVIDNFEYGNPLPQWVFDAAAAAEQAEPGNVIEEAEYRRKLLDVQAFVQSIVSPPPGAFDEARAEAGMKLFFGKANCASCHSSAEGTGRPGEYFTNIVQSAPQGILASGIKVPGLRGLAFTAPYFHDASAQTLADVVVRYTSPDIPEVPSTLTDDEQASLVEYLKSL